MKSTLLSRRQVLGLGAGGTLLATLPQTLHANTIKLIGARIWSAQTYTRLTLETDAPLSYTQFTLTEPHRLVIDIKDLPLTHNITQLAKLVKSNDPYIKNIRVGKKDDYTVRMVLDLKGAVTPQLFSTNPAGQFKNRLVIDLYPNAMAAAESNDPIMDLLNNKYNDKKQNQAHNSKTRTPIIMLDPGHGGEDPGASSPSGLREKNVVLQIARETKKQLEAQGYKVYLTRNEDVFIPLATRVLKAQKAKADLFVSIHADAAENRNARGTGVFAFSRTGASSEAARILAQSQNNADLIGGVKNIGNSSINKVLLDMVQNQTINDSLRLGKFVLTQLSNHNKLHQGRVEQANFAVLRSPDIPAILVESAFISNPEEERLLRSSIFHKKVASAITMGIRQYLKTAILAMR